MTNRSTFEFWKEQQPILWSMVLKPYPQSMYKDEEQEILSYLPCLKDKVILDLGAGIGRFTRYFIADAHRVTAVDFAPHLLEKNCQNCGDAANVEFICSDVMDLQMKENSLDMVFINWVMIYLEDHEIDLLMDRIHRWLKPNGELFFRESCSLKREKSYNFKGYHAHYRTLSYYDALLEERFDLLKEGHLKTFVDYFATPFQCYWLCQKKLHQK